MIRLLTRISSARFYSIRHNSNPTLKVYKTLNKERDRQRQEIELDKLKENQKKIMQKLHEQEQRINEIKKQTDLLENLM